MNIYRLQSEEELELLQSRIKSQAKAVKVHSVPLRSSQGVLPPKDAQEALQSRTETELLKLVRSYLSSHPSVAWIERINAGGSRKHGSYVKYGFPGISDFIGMLKTGQFLAVECKTKDGRLSQDQAAFLARVDMWGGVSGVVRSIEDLKALLSAEP